MQLLRRIFHLESCMLKFPFYHKRLFITFVALLGKQPIELPSVIRLQFPEHTSMNLVDQLNPQEIPTHIAVIMDGNGRWARKRGNMRVFGHRNAIKAVRDTTEGAAELGVKFLTLYAFSTENWKRPKAEVDAPDDLVGRNHCERTSYADGQQHSAQCNWKYFFLTQGLYQKPGRNHVYYEYKFGNDFDLGPELRLPE